MDTTESEAQHTVRKCRRDVLVVRIKGVLYGLLTSTAFCVLFRLVNEDWLPTILCTILMGYVVGGSYIADFLPEKVDALEEARKEATV